MWVVYKVTNLINNKKYLGYHGDSKDSNYLGSGPIIRKAVAKYGRENFEKEILFSFDTEEDARDCERFLVTEREVQDPTYYNIKVGGYGGFTNPSEAGTKGALRAKELNVGCFFNSLKRKEVLETLKETKKGIFSEDSLTKSHNTQREKELSFWNSNQQSKNSRKRSKVSDVYRMDGEFVGRYEAKVDIARDLGLTNNQVQFNSSLEYFIKKDFETSIEEDLYALKSRSYAISIEEPLKIWRSKKSLTMYINKVDKALKYQLL